MNKNNLILRYVFFFLGLAVNSFGIAFITKSALGTSPISAFHMYAACFLKESALALLPLLLICSSLLCRLFF